MSDNVLELKKRVGILQDKYEGVKKQNDKLKEELERLEKERIEK